MNTLTKNRILEKGDVYKEGDQWRPVPETNWGLQVMFTKYSEVRRPSEKPLGSGGTSPSLPVSQESRVESRPQSPPISHKASNTKDAQGTASPKATAIAEADRVPASGVSPAGGESRPTFVTFPAAIALQEKARKRGVINPERFATHQLEQMIADIEKDEKRKLPTVVSKKAHKRGTSDYIPEIKIVAPAGVENIPYPDGSPPCDWIGRNGTFTARGLRLDVFENLDEKDNIIRVRPIGKRGVAKNALIEFPASVIPQVVDWLLRMQPAPTTPK